MELTEAFRRVVLRHKRIIVLFILLGAAIPIGLSYVVAPTYTASARLVLTSDPSDVDAATAIADGAEGIVTSPDRVTAAMSDAGVTGDPIEFARDMIQVRPLGTSGVLELSVTTEAPDSASQMANQLAKNLLDTREQISDNLNQRLGQLRGQRRELGEEIDATAVTDTVALAGLNLRLTSVLTDISSVQSELAARPQAEIISAATPPAAADPSGRITETALGIMLGLIIGIGVAAFVELLRPTVAGPSAVARGLGTRVLGSASRVGERFAPIEPTDPMVVRLRLAAASESVTTIEVLAVPSDLSATSLAYRLEEALSAAGPRGRSRRTLTVRAFGLEATPGMEGPSAAVVVAEPSLAQKELDAAHDLLSLAELPVLGVIVADKPRRRGRRRREAAIKAKPERATSEQLVVIPNEPEPQPVPSGEPAPVSPSPVRPVRPTRPTRPVRKAASATGSTRIGYTPRPGAGARVEPAAAGVPSRAEQRNEPTRDAAALETEQASAEAKPGSIEPGSIEPQRIEPERNEPERIEPERNEPERIEPERNEPERIEPEPEGAKLEAEAGSAPVATPVKTAPVDASAQPTRVDAADSAPAAPTTSKQAESMAPKPTDQVQAPASEDTAAESDVAVAPAGAEARGAGEERTVVIPEASVERASDDGPAATNGSEGLAFQPPPRSPRRPAPKKRPSRSDGQTSRSATDGGTDDGPSSAAGGRASAR